MADTISAAATWSQGDPQMGFIVPVDVAAGPDRVVAPIQSAAVNDAPPGLVVDFVTLTADASGWTYDPAAGYPPEQASPTVSGYAAAAAVDDAGPVVLGGLGAG